MAQHLRIQLLGKFQVHLEDSSITDIDTSYRLQSLLALLVLNNAIPQPRAHIANLFWPASSTSQARTNLRKLLYQLKCYLPNGEKYLIFDRNHIQWNPSTNFSVDVFELRQHLDTIKQNPFELALLTKAATKYTGKLLPQIDDEWIQSIRFTLHEQMLYILERLVRLFNFRKQYIQAILYATKLVKLEPTDESYYCQLMRLHNLNGDKIKALEIYQKCFSMLRRELNLQPKPTTQALYQNILSSTHPFALDIPTWPLPEQLPLVSRQVELKHMQKLLAQMINGRTHCLLITGETGIGKTRLAEELLDHASQQGIVVARSLASNLHHNLALNGASQLFSTPEIIRRLSKIEPFWFREIIRLFPELLDEYPKATYQTKNSTTDSRSQRLIFESMARGILIDNQPTILFFDDLQWVDEETLNWLYYLLLYQRHTRLLVIGTYCNNEGNNQTFEKLRHNLYRQDLLTQINLSTLDQAATAMLASLFTKRPLPVEQQKTIYQLTMGNPRAIEDLLRPKVDTLVDSLKSLSFRQTVA
ncbi:MAG: AAA family ATPase [Ardenticatenaceae bacterium]|nr:AAA family ATPase [Ardenticatenaceae bacterium]MCB8948833.1 AAA family ATPase [Ardenticatenaceae bacterium]